VGALRGSKEERKFLAKDSTNWKCHICQKSNGQIASEYMTEVTEGGVKNLQAENVLGKELSHSGFAKKEENPKPKVEE